MMSSSPPCITADGFDHIEIAALERRLEETIELAKQCAPGLMTTDEAKPSKNQAALPTDRHTTFYGPADLPPATAARHTFSITTGPHHRHNRREALSIVLAAGKSRLGLELTEPIGCDRFNNIPPSAPADAIVAGLSRWKERASLIIPFQDDQSRIALDQKIQHSHHLLFELLRSGEPAYDNLQIFYATEGGAPFSDPQVFITGIGSTPFKNPLPALTREGQSICRAILPQTLSITRTIVRSKHCLSLHQRTFGDDWMGSPLSVIDLMRELSKYDIGDTRPLVRRRPRSA